MLQIVFPISQVLLLLLMVGVLAVAISLVIFELTTVPVAVRMFKYPLPVGFSILDLS